MMNNRKIEPAPQGRKAQTNNQKDYNKYLKLCQKGTQEYIILNHIIRHGGITALESVQEYSITRLSARIFNLRELGIPIRNIRQSSRNGKRFVRYVLEDEDGNNK